MKIIKQIIIYCMLFFFLISALTGIIKVPETQKFFVWIYDFIPASRLSFLHDWSGVFLAVLIAVHLALKKDWFFRQTNNPHLSPRVMRVAFLAIVMIFTGVAIYLASAALRNTGTIQLAGVEVREYKGEKLGSINDFRENSIKGPQIIAKYSYRLQIAGLVEKPLSLSYNELLDHQSYEKVVTLDCVEGWKVKALWKGILVRDLLDQATTKSEASTVIFYAADGYSTSFPLEYFRNNDIIMAYDLNGLELPPARGFPLQLVAEDKWGYKWIKWITKIELSDNSDYKGFWESRGYNNNGDLKGSKFAE